MKIKLSKNQWEGIGKKAGWMKKADDFGKYELGIAPSPNRMEKGDFGYENSENKVIMETEEKMRELGATPEQIDAAGKYVMRYKEAPLSISPEIGGWGAIMLRFKTIVIGIEKDGHAHS